MGYFDALTSSAFKTTTDGSRLFFPWGIWARGYIIGSELEYKRLRSRIKTYLIVGMGVAMAGGLAVVASQEYLAGIVAGAIGVVFNTVFYVAWVPRLSCGLQPSPEKLSWRESVASQGREHSLVLLWLMELGSIAFVACGISIVVANPEHWLIAISGILFFGLCAGVFAFMLILRRRA